MYSPRPLDDADIRSSGKGTRWLYGLTAAGLAGLLLIAVSLTPSASGYGTHRGLGLPPCTLQAIWGVRCPACGMTTAWANIVRGRLVAALRASATGTLLAIGALAAIPCLVLAAWRGRWVLPRPHEFVVLATSATLLALMLVEWLIRIGFTRK